MLLRGAICPTRAFAKRISHASFTPCSTFSSLVSRHGPNQRPHMRTASPNWRSLIRTASSASPQAAAAPVAQTSLNWNDFFALRRTRRRIGQVCSGIGAIGVTYYGLTVMISKGYDSELSAFLGGLDPFMLMGITTMAMMAVGWLIGPVFGNQAFNLAYRGVLKEFSRKDSAFFNRIKRHRVGPTASSLANPPPDYYGEKIGSVAGYRRWLKDQRAFNLKTGRYRSAKQSGDISSK